MKEMNTSIAVHKAPVAREDMGSCFDGNAKTRSSELLRRQEPPPLADRMLIVPWQDETASRVYRIQELWTGQYTGINADGLDSLRHEVFMSILVTDCSFSPDSDILLYNCGDEGAMIVSNEKIWRAALWDMFNQDQRYFRFRLQRKGTL